MSIRPRLKVYDHAIFAHTLLLGIADQAPRGTADLLDQLRRASRSVVLNVAEAAGKSSRADQRRIFQIARGSALECGACLDLLEIEGFLPKTAFVEARDTLGQVYAMLTALILSPRS